MKYIETTFHKLLDPNLPWNTASSLHCVSELGALKLIGFLTGHVCSSFMLRNPPDSSMKSLSQGRQVVEAWANRSDSGPAAMRRCRCFAVGRC